MQQSKVSDTSSSSVLRVLLFFVQLTIVEFLGVQNTQEITAAPVKYCGNSATIQAEDQ